MIKNRKYHQFVVQSRIGRIVGNPHSSSFTPMVRSSKSFFRRALAYENTHLIEINTNGKIFLLNLQCIYLGVDTRMTIQIKKELYKKKLLAGLIKSYKAKKPIIGPRIPLSGKGRTVIQNCNGLCQVCGEEYVKNTHGFIIHHIDGNRTNNDDKNLALMAATYHNAIHGEVNVIFNAYKKDHPIIPKPKPTPKPKCSSKSEYGDISVFERWRKAEQESQDKWRNAVNVSLKNLGYDF